MYPIKTRITTNIFTLPLAEQRGMVLPFGDTLQNFQPLPNQLNLGPLTLRLWLKFLLTQGIVTSCEGQVRVDALCLEFV